MAKKETDNSQERGDRRKKKDSPPACGLLSALSPQSFLQVS